MTGCFICYEDIRNKVSLECTHELCLNCFVNTLKVKNKFSCPMCRHKYDFYLKDEEQVFEVPEGYMSEPYDPGYEIDIIPEQQSIFQGVISTFYPEHVYKFYRTAVNSNIFYFIIIHSINIEPSEVDDNIISHLLFNLLTDQLPQENNYIQKLRQGLSNVGNHKLLPTNCYLQDYHDIIIKKLECL